MTAQPVAYFEFKGSGTQDFFVIQLVEQVKIDNVRRILSGEETGRVHPQGTIVQQKAFYNPKWSFYLEPKSVDFFELNIEVCDANMNYIEQNLDAIGGATLPRLHWCPWNSHFTRELSPQDVGAP